MAVFDEKNKKGLLKKVQPKGNSIFVESEAVRRKEDKEKKISVKSSFAEITPITDITGNGFLELSNDDGFMEIVQVSSTDIYALNNSDKEKKLACSLFSFNGINTTLKLFHSIFRWIPQNNSNLFKKN
ncbi:hypothetical protein [Sinobaca sp. H24]|uniref:hypothetical protein n=1 Tax=Sinobaca sp. H24 TaxID=2923376 RepID=UPI0020798DF9|nr:hypothetical protein [Sinobaca sp. H24]